MTVPADDRAMLDTVSEMIDEIVRLEALSQGSGDSRRDGWISDQAWIYNQAVEEFGHSMAAMAPRLLALARRGLHAQQRQDEHAQDLEVDGYTVISRDWDSILADSRGGSRYRFFGDSSPTDEGLHEQIQALRARVAELEAVLEDKVRLLRISQQLVARYRDSNSV